MRSRKPANRRKKMLPAMDDNPYMQARATDIEDIASRLIRDPERMGR